MSGQTSVAIEQSQAINSAEPDIGLIQENESAHVADPIASFLEKHGSSLVQNHEGQKVTVAEAMVSCPPFARLVAAMGEAALSLTAPKQEQVNEDESEEAEAEPEIEVETEGKTKEPEPKASVKEVEVQKTHKEAKKSDIIDEHTEQPEVTAVQQSRNVDESDGKQASVAEPASTSSELPQPPRQVKIAPISTGYQKAEGDTPKRMINVVDTDLPHKEASTTKAQDNVAKDAVVDTPQFERPALTLTPEAIFTSADAVLVEAEQDSNEENESVSEAYELPVPETKLENIEDFIVQIGVDPREDTPSTDDFSVSEEFYSTSEAGLEANYSLSDSDNSPIFTLPEQRSQDADINTLELSMPIEEVEQTVLLAIERIERLDEVPTEEVHQLLDHISQKVQDANHFNEIKFEDLEVGLKTEEIKEELKDLFIQLFDQIEIEYTPELVESFVILALKGDISEFISPEEEAETTAHKDRGTHEIIKQLLTAVGGLKRSILQAYQIGKTVLNLYSQQLSSA